MVTCKDTLKRIGTFLLVLLLVCSPLGCTAEPLPEEVTLCFVSVNDLHGYIEQDEDGKNGLSNTARAIDQLSEFYPPHGRSDVRDDIVLFANGDMFQGTGLSNMSRGRAVVEAMNAMRFDGMGLGNHEFDWGLETVLRFWDGDDSNGEADFPLVSGNVRLKENGNLLADVSREDRVVSSLMLEKMGVKIGLISVIGPCENSILASAVAPYTFEDVTESVLREATALRANGAEIVSVNIHYGNSEDVEKYEPNVTIGRMVDEKGQGLVDLIFNGHTHTLQKGMIVRENLTYVPVVQGGGNNSGIAYVKLTYNRTEKRIVSKYYDFMKVGSFGSEYDSQVEKIVRSAREETVGTLPVLAVSEVSLSSKMELTDYVAGIMVAATGADYAVANNGGLRGTGDIQKGKDITESNLYGIIPFDNEIIVAEMEGRALYEFWSASGDTHYFGRRAGLPSMEKLKEDRTVYRVAVIDYVYTAARFDSVRRNVTHETETRMILRDLLVEDVRLFGAEGLKWNPNAGPRIKNQLQ